MIFLFFSLFPIGKVGIKSLEKEYFYQKKIDKIDNIIVLAGPESPSITKLTKKFNIGDGSERLIASVKLSIIHPEAKIFFLGGDGKLFKSKFNEADVAKIFYEDIGFDISKVTFINNSRNTIENLKEFKKLNIVEKNNVLITSGYHMKRAMLIANYLKINIIPYAVDFKFNSVNFKNIINKKNIINYYQSFDLLKNFNLLDVYVKEVIGILAFKLFY